MTLPIAELSGLEDTLAEHFIGQASASQLPFADVCQPTEEWLAICAYFIWLSEGCPHGRDRDHWIQAEEQLLRCCQYDRICDAGSP
jgi:hypothetical protein